MMKLKERKEVRTESGTVCDVWWTFHNSPLEINAELYLLGLVNGLVTVFHHVDHIESLSQFKGMAMNLKEHLGHALIADIQESSRVRGVMTSAYFRPDSARSYRGSVALANAIYNRPEWRDTDCSPFATKIAVDSYCFEGVNIIAVNRTGLGDPLALHTIISWQEWENFVS
jgi:hypothetical protein